MSTAPAIASPPRARGLAVGEVREALTRGGMRLARAWIYLHDLATELRRNFPMPRGELPPRLPTCALTMQRVAGRLCSLHGVRVSVRGELPRGPVLLVANHLGWLDPLAIGSAVPCVAIAKREVMGWPLLGESVARLGNLFVDRGDAHSGAVVLRRAARCMIQGVSVLTFPEGTTSMGDEVLPLRRGIFGLARRYGWPVVPIAVRHHPRESAWVGDQSFLPHYLRTAARASTRVELSFGEPIDPSRCASAEALATLARIRLQTQLRGLRLLRGTP